MIANLPSYLSRLDPDSRTQLAQLNRLSSKVRQEFYWDGKSDVDLVFENDAKVKLELLKVNDSDQPIEGAVFNVLKDGQIIATEKTDASGIITVTNITEGLYAFVEVYVPAPYARLEEPVTVHVDQEDVDGGGTISVSAVDEELPTLTILKRDGQTGQVVPGAVFEVKGIHHGYHTDVTTGEDGTATLTGLPVDSYEVTEISVPDPYVVAAEPTQTIWLGPGDEKQLIFDNLKQPQLTIAKVDAADSTTPISGTVFRIETIDGDYQNDVTTGQDGTVTLRVAPGTYRVTELSVPAPYFLPDKDADRVQTISLNAGDEKKLVFKNSKSPELTIYKEDTGQIQITKTSADYNSMNGWPAGTPIPNTVFEIYNYRTGKLVDTIKTDKNGVAVSKPLPLGWYKVVEAQAAEFYGLDKTPIEAEIEFAGQIVKTAMTNKSLYTNVSIKKTGYVEVMPGQQIRYDFSGIGNNSTTSLTSFYWRDTLPTQAVRLDKIITGTYNVPGNYKVVYQTNLSGGTWRTMYDNLSTMQNYTLDASPAALGLASNEYVTQFMVSFGVVPSNFRQVEAPRVYCNVVSWLTGGTQFVNQADVGGVYDGQWIMATSRWVTKVYKPSEPLPRTGY